MKDLGRMRVLVIGVGGLGCPSAMALSRAGVGTIGLVDEDVVDITNLHRQILFSERDIGLPKVHAAARALSAATPRVVVETHRVHLSAGNAVDLFSRYDLVVEGTDDFAAKFLAADAAHLAERPIVHAAAVKWQGTAFAVAPRGGPCYRCLFEDIPVGPALNCAQAGVVGPVVGIVAAAQAELALSILDEVGGKAPFGKLFTFDGKTMAMRWRGVPGRASCALCGNARAITSIESTRYMPAICESVAAERNEQWRPS